MRKFDARGAAELIDGFYEAAARPELWRGLLQQMAGALGAEGCVLVPGPESPIQPVCSASMDELCAACLQQGWHDKNIRMSRGIEAIKARNGVITEAMLFSSWELDHLPFHAELINPFKLRSFAGMIIGGNGPTSLALSAERMVGQDPFSTSEVETLRQLLPHIRRAGQLSLRLASAHQGGLLDAFAIFNCGAILLDWQGRVLRTNAKADALMGPSLTVRAGVLTAGHKDSDSALQKLIASVIARGPQHEADPIGAIAIARPNARPLLVHAAPMAKSARDLFQQAQAALMIVDPDENRAPRELFLRQVFGLTNAEAAVATALACGQDCDEIAQMRGVRPTTIRIQIKSIFAKTNTRRQAELVALLLRCAPQR